MNTLAPHIKNQLEQYADGELGRSAVREVEAILSNSAAARTYIDALDELRVVPQIAVQDIAAEVDFARLEDSVMGAIFGAQASGTAPPSVRSAVAAARDGELESLTEQWVDGELHDPQQIQRVFEYLAQNPGARDSVESLRELQRVTRDYVRTASEDVDFNALYERTIAAVGLQEPSKAPAPEGEKVVQLQTWMQRFKAPLAAVAGIAAATAIMLPIALKTAPNGTTVINNYHLTNVDNMDVDPGYSGTYLRGSSKAAPVVWISDQAGTAPRSLHEGAPPTVTKDPVDDQPDDDVLDI